MTNQQMSRVCPDWSGDLAAYVVGALDPQPCAVLRRHLSICPACQAEYEDLVPVVGLLALVSPPAAGTRPVACGDRWNAQAVTAPLRAKRMRCAIRQRCRAGSPSISMPPTQTWNAHSARCQTGE